jgi:hypothetical protein
MMRYSSYGSTNYRARTTLPDPDPLETAYRELLELRERVRLAESAAARRRKSRDKAGFNHKRGLRPTAAPGV